MGKRINVPLRQATDSASLRTKVNDAVTALDMYGRELLQKDPIFGKIKGADVLRYRGNGYRLAGTLANSISKRTDVVLAKTDPALRLRRVGLPVDSTQNIASIRFQERIPAILEGAPVTISRFASPSLRRNVDAQISKESASRKLRRYVRRINSYNIRNRIPVWLNYETSSSHNPDSRPENENAVIEVSHQINVQCRPLVPMFGPVGDTVVVSTSEVWKVYSDKSLDEFLELCATRIEAEVAQAPENVTSVLLDSFQVSREELHLITRERINQWMTDPIRWGCEPLPLGVAYQGGAGWDKLMFVEAAIPHLPKLIGLFKTLSRRGHYVQEAFDIIPAESA